MNQSVDEYIKIRDEHDPEGYREMELCGMLKEKYPDQYAIVFEQEKNNEGQYDEGELTSPGPLIDYFLSDDSDVENKQLLEKIENFFTSDPA